MNIWNYHDEQLKKLKQLYNKTSKQTQNNLQTLLDTFKFEFDTLYGIANNRTKQRINDLIEQWQEKGLLEGYFGVLAKNIYSRTKVKNSEILELIIYSAYIEEQGKLQERELNTFKDVASYYYNEGVNEVRKANGQQNKHSVIPDAIFLALLDGINSIGYTWNNYIELSIMNNVSQMNRQVLINLQQQKELKMDSDEFKVLFDRQNKQKLNINGEKVSGVVDMELIHLNNQAKIKGIESQDKNAKVKFVSDLCDNVTDMCERMNGMEFYINKENVFDRYWGETKKELKLMRVRANGLIPGVNVPPIMHHFHWCHSWITYQVPVEKEEKTEYNLDIPKINKDVKKILKDKKLNGRVKKLFNKYLIDDNIIIDASNKKPMYYDTKQDKIIINNNHKDFDRYNLSEALSHETIHLIEKRNKLTDKIDIERNILKAQSEILLDSDKYTTMFKDNRYADNMTLSDIFSSLTYDNIAGNIGHDFDYWYNIDNIKSELSANIMSAYLNNNTDTLKVIDSINSLKNIKEEVIKKYDKYTR